MSTTDTAAARNEARATRPMPIPFSQIAAGLAANGYVTQRGRQRLGGLHRTGRPVRRDSLEEGTFEEGLFFRAYAKAETYRWAAEVAALYEKKKALARRLRREPTFKPSRSEQAILAITETTVWTMKAIARLAVATGQVFLSLDGFAAEGRSRSQISKAIAVLCDLGYIVKQRRFKRVPVEGEKTAYRQTSNVYRPTPAKWLQGFLPRWMRPSPMPVCEEQREVDRREENGRMFGQLTCRELAQATVSSGPLADILARLGAGIDAVEGRVRKPYCTSD